ncbi:hypothetical protein HAX54_004571, partial [Datura stramonium]|nr:hypothetical protein [Datura stramonium]
GGSKPQYQGEPFGYPTLAVSGTEPSHGTPVEVGKRQFRGSVISFCRVCGRRHAGRVEGSRLYVLLVVLRVTSSCIFLFEDRVARHSRPGLW